MTASRNTPDMSLQAEAAANTDRELWREREGDYYTNSIHVTAQGGIGINVGGTVIVRSLAEWHALAALEATPSLHPEGEGLTDRIARWIESHDLFECKAGYTYTGAARAIAEDVAAMLHAQSPTVTEGTVPADLDALASEYAAAYVMSTEGADYQPTNFERSLIEDALHGFLAEMPAPKPTTVESSGMVERVYTGPCPCAICEEARASSPSSEQGRGS